MNSLERALDPPPMPLQATNVVWIPWNMLFIALYEEAKRAATAAGFAVQTPSSGSEAQNRSSGRGEEEPGNHIASTSETKSEDLPAWVLGLCSAGERSSGIL